MMKACVLKDVSTFEVKEVERPTLVENGEVTGWWKVAARDRRLTL